MNSISRNEVYKVLGVAAIWVIILKNPSAFFVGLGIAPIDTIAGTLGLILVPIVPTYFPAKYIANKFEWSVYRTWMTFCVALLLLLTIGMFRSAS